MTGTASMSAMNTDTERENFIEASSLVGVIQHG